MYRATRFDTLCQMVDLRWLYGVEPPAAETLRRRAASQIEREDGPEACILEIAEVAYVLHADGVPISEAAERIGRVFGPMPIELAQSPIFLREYLLHLLHVDEPEYLKRGEVLFEAAFALATLWAELYAAAMISSHWPPLEILSGPWDISGHAGIWRREDDNRGGWPVFTRSLADLDILLDEYGTGGLARDVRRMKARVNAGDKLHGFSTGKLSWAIMGGRSGIALVRDGRSIDFLETMMN